MPDNARTRIETVECACHNTDVDVTRRQRYHHGNLQAAVLDEAVSDLATSEPVALNINRIAKRLGVTHSAVYRHYPSKQDLIAALATRGFESLGDDLEAALVGMDDAGHFERIVQMGLAYIHWAVNNSTLMRVTFSSAIDRRRPDLSTAAQRAIGFLHGEVLAAGGEGQLKVANPADVTRFLWAGVHGEAIVRLDSRFSGLPGLSDDPVELSLQSARWLVSAVLHEDKPIG